MRALLIVAVVVGGCDRKPAPPKNEFEAFERKFVHQTELLAKASRRNGREIPDKDIPTSYRAVFIGPSGVFVDRKLVATLAELDTRRAELVAAIDANMKLLPTIGFTPSMTFDLDAQPASVAISALRLFAGREMLFERRSDDPEVPELASQIICGETTVRDAPIVDKVKPQISVLVEADRTWIGLSRLREFQELPDRAGELDVEKLEIALKMHKADELLADRDEIELAASGGTSREVLAAFGVVCELGFVKVSVVSRDQLAAPPDL
jgi:hypothetical protein